MFLATEWQPHIQGDKMSMTSVLFTLKGVTFPKSRSLFFIGLAKKKVPK